MGELRGPASIGRESKAAADGDGLVGSRVRLWIGTGKRADGHETPRRIMFFVAATGGRPHGAEQTQAHSGDGSEPARF